MLVPYVDAMRSLKIINDLYFLGPDEVASLFNKIWIAIDLDTLSSQNQDTILQTFNRVFRTSINLDKAYPPLIIEIINSFWDGDTILEILEILKSSQWRMFSMRFVLSEYQLTSEEFIDSIVEANPKEILFYSFSNQNTYINPINMLSRLPDHVSIDFANYKSPIVELTFKDSVLKIFEKDTDSSIWIRWSSLVCWLNDFNMNILNPKKNKEVTN